jgi:DNA modification methylase
METIRNRIIKNELVDIEKLTPFQGKLKTLDDKNFNKLRKSIVEEGFSFTVHVWQNDKTIYIIDGHQRVSVLTQMRKQGIKVPPISCAFVSAETYRDAKKLVLLAISQYGKIQKDGFLEFVDGEDFDFGDYDFPDLTFDISSLFENQKGEFDESKEDDIPDEAPARVKIGEIWQLGDHRLMCGDSTKKDDVNKLMNGCKADICFTSPPYNAGSMEIAGNTRTGKKYKTFDDNQTEAEFFKFLMNNLNCMLDVCEEIFYNIGMVEKNKRTIVDVLAALRDNFKDVIYWNKTNPAPHIQPGIINNKVEFILCFGQSNCGNRKFSNAQFSQGTYWNVIDGNNASGNAYSSVHKATFPVYLPENIIKNFCPPKGTVVDCFCGTGSTIVAAEKLGRSGLGMELDPHYCDIIIERWEKLTGKKAERVSDGG